MRERGTQVRRARLAEAGAGKPPPKPPNGGIFWPAVAVMAIIVATAGWTVVAVMALNGPAAPGTAQASPTDEDPDEFAEESEEPIEVTHDYPALEELLPDGIDGITFEKQSWTAGLYGPDDGLTDEIIAAIAAAGKTEADLHGAGAADPDFNLDGVVTVYQIEGVPLESIRDAWVAYLVTNFPGFETTTVTIADRTVTRGGEAEGSFWWAYIVGDYLFVIDGLDEDLATRLLATLSEGPATEASPPASVAPTPEPSADASAS